MICTVSKWPISAGPRTLLLSSLIGLDVSRLHSLFLFVLLLLVFGSASHPCRKATFYIEVEVLPEGIGDHIATAMNDISSPFDCIAFSVDVVALPRDPVGSAPHLIVIAD